MLPAPVLDAMNTSEAPGHEVSGVPHASLPIVNPREGGFGGAAFPLSIVNPQTTTLKPSAAEYVKSMRISENSKKNYRCKLNQIRIYLLSHGDYGVYVKEDDGQAVRGSLACAARPSRVVLDPPLSLNTHTHTHTHTHTYTQHAHARTH